MSALCVEALSRTVERGRRLLSFDASLVAPVAPGPVEVAVEVLRAGRFVTQAAATLHQNGAVVSRVHGVFGSPRESSVVVDAPLPRPGLPIERARRLPFIPGVTPTFTQFFELRWSEGGMPFSGAREARLGGWCRHLTPATGLPALVALLDVWPAPVLPMATRPAPASTVRWSAHLVEEHAPPADGWYWFEGHAVTSRGGYATTLGHLYAGERLVAWTEQLVAVFDSKSQT